MKPSGFLLVLFAFNEMLFSEIIDAARNLKKWRSDLKEKMGCMQADQQDLSEKMLVPDTVDITNDGEFKVEADTVIRLLEGLRHEKLYVRQSLEKIEKSQRLLTTFLNHTFMALDRDMRIESDKNKETLKADIEKYLKSIKDDLVGFTEKAANMERKWNTLDKTFKCVNTSWEYYNNSCYYFGKDVLSWHDAKLACEKENAYLVEIDSSAENEYLLAKWNDVGLIKGYRGPSVGLSDAQEEGKFIWAGSGRELSITDFQDWGAGEPNGGRSENCVHKASWMPGWNDQQCILKTTYTCERPIQILV